MPSIASHVVPQTNGLLDTVASAPMIHSIAEHNPQVVLATIPSPAESTSAQVTSPVTELVMLSDTTAAVHEQAPPASPEHQMTRQAKTGSKPLTAFILHLQYITYFTKHNYNMIFSRQRVYQGSYWHTEKKKHKSK